MPQRCDQQEPVKCPPVGIGPASGDESERCLRWNVQIVCKDYVTPGQDDEGRTRKAHEVPDQPISSWHRDSRTTNWTTSRRRRHQADLSLIATGTAVLGSRCSLLYAAVHF